MAVLLGVYWSHPMRRELAACSSTSKAPLNLDGEALACQRIHKTPAFPAQYHPSRFHPGILGQAIAFLNRPRNGAMSSETASTTLPTLPGEIQNMIVGDLEPFDLLLLRATCRHFRNVVPRLDIGELLVAECSKTAMERDLYACCLCLRLRRASHFADKMIKKQKRKLAGGGSSRFCVQCGVKPPPGKSGYGSGTFITKKNVVSVLCIYCVQLGYPAQDENGKTTQYCARCWAQTPEGREMRRLEEAELQREREWQKKEQEERETRRRERRAICYSDYEDSDEEGVDDLSDEERYLRFAQMHIDGGDWRDVLA